MQNRAIRRAHRERLKKARRFHWGRDLSQEPKFLAMAIDTPTTCSCAMCCNPRRRKSINHKGEPETIQERRWKQKDKQNE